MFVKKMCKLIERELEIHPKQEAEKRDGGTI